MHKHCYHQFKGVRLQQKQTFSVHLELAFRLGMLQGLSVNDWFPEL